MLAFPAKCVVCKVLGASKDLPPPIFYSISKSLKRFCGESVLKAYYLPLLVHGVSLLTGWEEKFSGL